MVGTGCYEITRIGTRRERTVLRETYETPMGEMSHGEWKEKALAEITQQGELDLLEKIQDYCRKHCAWLRKKEETEEYAINCLCSRAYRAWEDFGNTEEIIWM